MLERVVSAEPSRLLHRLEGHAANAGLFQREFDNLAKFAVVHSALDGYDQCRRYTQIIQPLQRTPANAAKVRAPKLQQWIAPQRVELQIQFEIRHILGEPFRERFIGSD